MPVIIIKKNLDQKHFKNTIKNYGLNSDNAGVQSIKDVFPIVDKILSISI
jgi:hypothetical protein